MPKIVQLKEEVAMIGMDDGSLKEVRVSDLYNGAQLGDEVDVFESETNIIVSKKEKKQEKEDPSSGININVSNVGSANQAPTYVANRKKVVNKAVYCLLALFLGGLGIHKFYSGRIGMGIVYIIFCWTFIPCIIAVIECIIALCQASDENGNILI